MNAISLKTAVATGIMAIAGVTQAAESAEVMVNQGNTAWNTAFNAKNADALAAL